MEYPEDVLTKNKKGQKEVRSLVARGKFVLYDYRDPESFKSVEGGKKKICLKDDEGKVQAFYIIPLKAKNKYLMIEDEDASDKKIWNSKKKLAEDLFC